jgi:phenylpropionate dioxygenase-like ring-hydroxylating dioxygenase large terminal subunit
MRIFALSNRAARGSERGARYCTKKLRSRSDAMIDPEKLIDLERKTVSPQVFADPEVHRLEQERIFTRCWLYVGHESQLPNPGDFIAGFMGEEPVIVCRGADRQIRVFLNSCRHRGMLVCRVEEGNAKFFRCPYHGWTYDLEGQLTGVRSQPRGESVRRLPGGHLAT